jgi:ferredoxin
MAYYIHTPGCILCGYCAEVCTNGAIAILPDGYKINPLWCTECGACEAMCYPKAIFHESLDMEENSSNKIFEELIVYYQEQEFEEFSLM